MGQEWDRAARVDARHAVQWAKTFCVGDDRLDREHRAMLASCNDLCALAAQGGSFPGLKVLAEELVAEIEDHFNGEEKILALLPFAERQAHQAEHDAIRTLLVTRLLVRGLAHPAEVAAEIRHALLDHIAGHDMLLCRFQGK